MVLVDRTAKSDPFARHKDSVKMPDNKKDCPNVFAFVVLVSEFLDNIAKAQTSRTSHLSASLKICL